MRFYQELREHIPLSEVFLFALCVSLVLLLLTAFLVSTAHAQEPVTCPQVCPACNVKAEWTDKGYQYEYTDNTAIITGTTPISVCWQAQGSHVISSVCIKAGQMLFRPDPSLDCWTTPWQHISHIVICTEESTAIELTSFRAVTLPDVALVLYLIGMVGVMAFGLYTIVTARRPK
jgi:hypothetical protein